MTDETPRRERPNRSSRHRDRDRDRDRDRSERTQPRRTRSQRARRARTDDEEEVRTRRESQSLSSGVLAQLERENVRQQRDRDRRQRRAQAEERHQKAERRYRERERDREREQEHERERERERDELKERERGREREMLEEIARRKQRGKSARQSRSRPVGAEVVGEGRTRGMGPRGDDWRDNSVEEEYFLSSEKTEQRSRSKKKKKKWIIIAVCAAVVLLIIVVAAVLGSKKSSHSGGSSGGGSGSSNIGGISHSDIPAKWQGTYLDPFTWATTQGFNVTFTDQMVGDLPVMGLNSKWDDSTRANSNVPPLNKPWGGYDKTPARGVNLGGWLSIEPFITPSLFTQRGVVDEYTLCQSLGPSANKTIEDHYATFVTEQTFKDIQAAGLDHVRIPFSYWAVETYPGDPYVYRTSWRYLLRGIEWARKYGLRVNLDVHGLPGSQNGWNHSGRLGPIGWLNGTDGQLNAQRSLDVHDRLSKFFAQDRYKNIITHYGLANEPRMTLLKTEDVVSWTETAYQLVRKNGVDALVIFGDGFMGLENWQGVMQGYDGLVLDVHQYVIFNENQIDFSHQAKIQYACDGWTQQAQQSSDTRTGYGPTLFAEWSQADTDCAKFLNNVGRGTRWEGTFDTGDPGTSVLKPDCPAKDLTCSCAGANADPGRWTPAYKQFLLMFAEAQMHSFEKGLGWWYWTWKTESAPQWSYEAGLAAGVLPKKPGQRSFNCDTDVPDFAAAGLAENY